MRHVSAKQTMSESGLLHTRLVNAAEAIPVSAPDRIDFLHSVLCQIGLPRREVHGKTFERRNGHMSLLLEAGCLWDGEAWIDQVLPYGVIPRLVMIHLSSEAVRTRSRVVDAGESVRQFLLSLNMPVNGGARGGYSALKRQVEGLAACRLKLGFHANGVASTVDTTPIRRFDAFLHARGDRLEWPGAFELTPEYFDTLCDHAVPLDPRAIAALRHSALALDVYCWLAHRLCRVTRPNGCRLSWQNLRDQFGQEYRCPRNFKRKFRVALRQAIAVYSHARLQEVAGGLILRASPSPLPSTAVRVVSPI